MKSKTAFEEVVAKLGSQTKLANLLGLKQSTVSYWAKTGIPAERAVEIETATDGEVPRWLCRPDLWSRPAAESPSNHKAAS
jgi:DNA-binding transcriptional regulator YdaS (Cro superfamily)